MSEVGLAESAQYVELRKWVGTVRPLTMDSTGSGPNCGLRKPAQHSRLHGRRGELWRSTAEAQTLANAEHKRNHNACLVDSEVLRLLPAFGSGNW